MTPRPGCRNESKMIKDVNHTEIHLTYLGHICHKVQWAAAKSELIMPFSIILIQEKKIKMAFLKLSHYYVFEHSAIFITCILTPNPISNLRM